MTQLPSMDLYGALLFQVTGQQLSVAATRRTLARIQALFGGHLPAPAELLAVDPSELRQAGLSWRTSTWPGTRLSGPYEPGEDWYWCYLDQLMFELQGAPPAPSHP